MSETTFSASNIAARAAQMANAEGDAPEPAVDENANAAPPAAEASPAGSAAPPAAVADEEAKRAKELKLAEMEERLAKIREKNAARRLKQWAQKQREQIENDKRSVAEQKQLYDGLRGGTFKETLEKLGRDPRQAFEEMQREAVEAGTPEAEIKRMRAEFERQLQEKLAPLDEVKKELAALKEERERDAQAARSAKLESAFLRSVQDAKYTDLRVEYDDAGLLPYVKHLDDNPDQFFALARKHNVRLTNPAKGYTMTEILDVLAAEQAQHRKGIEERRQRAQATANPERGSAGGGVTPRPTTVNGTAPSGNAGSTITNDLASTTATRTNRRLSRQQRIDAEIERLSRR